MPKDQSPRKPYSLASSRPGKSPHQIVLKIQYCSEEKLARFHEYRRNDVGIYHFIASDLPLLDRNWHKEKYCGSSPGAIELWWTVPPTTGPERITEFWRMCDESPTNFQRMGICKIRLYTLPISYTYLGHRDAIWSIFADSACSHHSGPAPQHALRFNQTSDLLMASTSHLADEQQKSTEARGSLEAWPVIRGQLYETLRPLLDKVSAPYSPTNDNLSQMCSIVKAAVGTIMSDLSSAEQHRVGAQQELESASRVRFELQQALKEEKEHTRGFYADVERAMSHMHNISRSIKGKSIDGGLDSEVQSS